MNQLIVESFRDLMQHGACTIACLMSGQIVRTLTVVGDNCHLVAGDGTELDIPLDTPVVYEPWMMDRGSMNFTLGNSALKLCTELDVLTAESGEYSVIPRA